MFIGRGPGLVNRTTSQGAFPPALPGGTALVDNCVWTPLAGGLGDWYVTAPVQGSVTPLQAGAVVGKTYSYAARSADNSQWELGSGMYLPGALTRSKVTSSSNNGLPVNFGTVPTVSLDALTADLGIAQAPAWTVKGNSTSGALPTATDLGPAAFLRYLSSNNNLASTLYLFNANTIVSPVSPSSPAYQFKFGPPLAQFITDANRSAVVGQSVQNVNPSVAPAIVPAVIGYGVITPSGAGNQVQGVFARGEAQAPGGATGIEIDAWNTSGLDSPDSYPAVDSYGTGNVWTFGAKIAPAGTNINWAGINFVQEPTPPGNSSFRVGIYATPAVFQHYGLFFDADATHSPTNSAYIRNTGQGSNLHLGLQTMGSPVVGNPVMQCLDALGNVVTNLKQSGQFITGDNINMSGALNFMEITNTNAAAGSNAAVFAASSAGAMRMEMDQTGNAVLRSAGAATLFIDSLNAAGNMALRVGSAPTPAITVSSAAAVAFPAVGTTASAANAFLDNANSNNLLRSTSSARYKHDIQPIADAASVLTLRPVRYRSKAAADRADWSWYGLIAEEVAAVDPRLVHWSYLIEDMEEVVLTEMWDDDEIIDDAGNVARVPNKDKPIHHIEWRPKAGAQLVPESVMYDRVAVLLLEVVQKQERRIARLEKLLGC